LIQLSLIFFVFLLPVFCRELRQGLVVLPYTFVILLHEVVAVLNAYFFTTLGADKDAYTFHVRAQEIAYSGSFTFQIGSGFYENMLGAVYWLTEPSIFLGEQLSILAFALSTVILLKILSELNISHYRATILMFYGAMPTMVLLGSVTLRESFQVLFFMMTVYYALKIHAQNVMGRNHVSMLVAAFLMGCFHKGLIVYTFFLVVVLTVYALKPERYLNAVLNLVVLLGATFICFAFYSVILELNINGGEVLHSFSAGEVLEFASQYRANAVPSRATYGGGLDMSSLWTSLASITSIYVSYLMAPFLWNVESILDVYAALESLLRFVLICFTIIGWKNARSAQRRALGLILVLFLSMTFLWSIGTTNYGTALRHHMLTWWLVVVGGVPSLMKFLNRLFKVSLSNHSEYSAGK